MSEPISRSLVVLGASLLLGLIALGWLIGHAAVKVKSLERTVVVKGLSEREVPANIAIWPLTFQELSNDLNGLFETIQRKNALIVEFLAKHGIAREAISVAAPAVNDLHASPTATRARSCTATRRVPRSRSTRTTSKRCGKP